MQIPDNLSYEQAATLPLGLGTAAIGMYGRTNGIGLMPPWKHGGVGKYRNMPILIFGGVGSVGNYGRRRLHQALHDDVPDIYFPVIQLAKMSGFSPIITTAALKHTEYLKGLGATHVIDRYLSFAGLQHALARITSAPINVIYDTVSIRETQEGAWALLGPQGRLVLTLPSVIDKHPGDRREIVLTNGNPHMEENWETGRQLWLHLTRWLEKGEIQVSAIDSIEKVDADKVRGTSLTGLT